MTFYGIWEFLFDFLISFYLYDSCDAYKVIFFCCFMIDFCDFVIFCKVVRFFRAC